MESLGWAGLPQQGSVCSRPPPYSAHRWKDRQAPEPAPLPLLPPRCPLPFPSSDTADCGRASVLESSNRERETTRSHNEAHGPRPIVNTDSTECNGSCASLPGLFRGRILPDIFTIPHTLCFQLHRHPGHPGEDTSHITMSSCWHSAVYRACFKPLFHVGVTLFISLGS